MVLSAYAFRVLRRILGRRSGTRGAISRLGVISSSAVSAFATYGRVVIVIGSSRGGDMARMPLGLFRVRISPIRLSGFSARRLIAILDPRSQIIGRFHAGISVSVLGRVVVFSAIRHTLTLMVFLVAA